jgi:hypothetical protein
MAFIETDWEHYFSDTHEGLGTTYERFVLHRYFERFRAAYAVERVLEAPSFGMTGVSGINSMWWAARGASVTVLDDNARRVNLIRRIWAQGDLPVHCFCVETFGDLPLQDGSIDLSWNFSALGFLKNPEACLAEMARITRRAIFICIPNERNLARNLHDLANGNDSPVRSNPRHIEAVLNALGWQAVERGFLDVPPWPDIAMKKEDFIQKIGLGRFLRRPDPSRLKRLCILDYFRGLEPAMESRLMRYSLLEGAPALLKMLWAHHRYLLFAPRSTPG